MQKRVRKVANFLAFNLLFFALYLNFIHKDKPGGLDLDKSIIPAAAAFSGTIPVDNPEKYLDHAAGNSVVHASVSEGASLAKHPIN